MSTKYQIIYWRDIPAQIKVRVGRQRVSRPLSKRFELAIDSAAMRAGLVGSDDYLAEWRHSEWQTRAGEGEVIADALVTEFEEAYPRERLKSLMDNGGREVSANPVS